MSDTPKIYAAMSAAMADIGAVGKEKRNQQQGFMYRGIDDVMNALYPVLSAHGLFLAPEVMEHTREERKTAKGGNLIYSIMKVRYTVYAEDGSSVSATVIGEGMDSADKSSNKAMAVAMKYALFQLFCIPTEEMGRDDPDADTPPQSAPDEPPDDIAHPRCTVCGKLIAPVTDKRGTRTPLDVAEGTQRETGYAMCYPCFNAWRQEHGNR